jgi:tight adherence protein C
VDSLTVGLAAIFVGLVGTLATLVIGDSQRRAVARSLAAMDTFRAVPRPMREQDLERPFSERVLGPLSGRFVKAGRQLTPDERLERIRRRLDLAGNPPGWDVDRVLGTKALGLLAGALIGVAAPPVFGLSIGVTVLAAVALAALGWFGPDLWLYQVGYDRKEGMQHELPDAIDLLTISVEAGLAFDAALAQVARNTDGPLAGELFRVLQEMQIGTGRLDALRALGDRTEIEELKVFVSAMVQADSFGIPIANVLRVQSKEMRLKRSQRAEEKAQKVPVKILFPLIFCILPCLFVVVIGPAAISILTRFGGLK